MRASTIALVLANLVPLVGVLAFGWSVYELYALYWSESVVIGGFTILRMLTVRRGGGAGELPAAIVLAAFFCVHYGLFLIVHGVFVVVLVGPGTASGREVIPGAGLMLLEATARGAGGLGLLALVASHGVSFVANFLGGERERTTTRQVMFAPYPRILAMHVCVLAGAILATTIMGRNAQGPMLGLLVVVKTVVDVLAHRAEHRSLREVHSDVK